MERPQYSWNQDTPEVPAGKRALQSMALGLILAAPLFFAAILAASATPRGAGDIRDMMAWTIGFSTAIASLPWLVVFGLIGGLAFGETGPVTTLLVEGVAFFASFSINASFALRKWELGPLALIAAVIAFGQCLVVTRVT